MSPEAPPAWFVDGRMAVLLPVGPWTADRDGVRTAAVRAEAEKLLADLPELAAAKDLTRRQPAAERAAAEVTAQLEKLNADRAAALAGLDVDRLAKTNAELAKADRSAVEVLEALKAKLTAARAALERQAEGLGRQAWDAAAAALAARRDGLAAKVAKLVPRELADELLDVVAGLVYLDQNRLGSPGQGAVRQLVAEALAGS